MSRVSTCPLCSSRHCNCLLYTSDSIKAKLALVNRYGLKGAGNWSAGQETTDVWDYYELWLNGTYFSDISNHFAKDEIIRLSGEGVLKGVSDSQFGPEPVSYTHLQLVGFFHLKSSFLLRGKRPARPGRPGSYFRCLSNQPIISVWRRMRWIGLPRIIMTWLSPSNSTMRVSTPNDCKAAYIWMAWSIGQR